MNEQDFARLTLGLLKVIEPTPDEVTEQERRVMYEILLAFRQDLGSYVKVWSKGQVPTFERSINNSTIGETNRVFAQQQLEFYYHDINAYHLTDELTLANTLEIFEELCNRADSADEKGTHSMLSIFLQTATNRIIFREAEQQQKAE